MKTIKLRAWDKENKRYVYQTLRELLNGVGDDCPDCITSEFRCLVLHCKVIPELYTGLKDKNKWEDLTEAERTQWTLDGNMPSEWNGKEIYEGDIVCFNWGSECIKCHEVPRWSGKVTFASLGARVRGYLINDPLNDIIENIEVIGNIHDNPKLMEGAK